MGKGRRVQWDSWDTAKLFLYLVASLIVVLTFVHRAGSGRSLIICLGVASFMLVALASNLQYKPLSLRFLWIGLFSVQFIAGSWLLMQQIVQGKAHPWASSLLYAPLGLALVLCFDRVNMVMHNDHFAMYSRGGIDHQVAGRRRARDSDILFTALSLVLPILIAEWLLPIVARHLVQSGALSGFL